MRGTISGRGLEVASRSLPVPWYPNHRGKFFDGVQRLLVSLEEIPYTLLGLSSRLLLGGHDLRVGVVLGGLLAGRLRHLMRVRRAFGGVGRRLWIPLLSPGYCHWILFARSILASFQRDLCLSPRNSGISPSPDGPDPSLLRAYLVRDRGHNCLRRPLFAHLTGPTVGSGKTSFCTIRSPPEARSMRSESSRPPIRAR